MTFSWFYLVSDIQGRDGTLKMVMSPVEITYMNKVDKRLCTNH
jgi:hypothetical protein